MDNLSDELIDSIFEEVGIDNKTIDQLFKKIYKSLKRFVKSEDADLLFSNNPQSPLIRKLIRKYYTEEQLLTVIHHNIKRIPGNLSKHDKMMEMYDTLELFEYQCPYSGTLLMGGEEKIHLDHIIPVSLGGPTDDWNCLPVCGSCNLNKNNKHLLDWWEQTFKPKDEYRLVKVYEYMTSKLSNKNDVRFITRLTDEQIKQNMVEEYGEDIQRLDVFTFLFQLKLHIQENNQYILSPQQIFANEQERQQAIEEKLLQIEQVFNQLFENNKKRKNVITDIELLNQQKQLIKHLKSLGIWEYYYLANTYNKELTEMIRQGCTDNQVIDFCNKHSRGFNFNEFYQKLIEYKNEFGDCLVPGLYKCADKYPLGQKVADIRKGQLKVNEQEKKQLYDIDFVWIVRGYEEDGIRAEIKRFVKEYLKFIEDNNGRQPSKKTKKEASLYNRWYTYTNIENLNDKEETYLKINGIKVRGAKHRLSNTEEVRQAVVEFVQDYLKFIKDNNGRKPNQRVEEELPLYARYLRYTNGDNLEQAEKEYLQANGIEVREIMDLPEGVRQTVVEFVEDYLKFIEDNNGRKPNQYVSNEEDALYQRYLRHTDATKLTQEEKDYLQVNGIEIRKMIDLPERVKQAVVEFVEDYLKFIKDNNGRKPNQHVSNEEKALYQRYLKYTDETNLTEEEKDYLKVNGIEIREIMNLPEGVRQAIVEFVQDYLKFIKDNNGRKPNQRVEEEQPLYSRYLRYTNGDNLEQAEKDYLKANGIELREVKQKIETPEGVRQAVVEFVQEYLKFIEDNHGRRPGRKTKKEYSLYDRWRRYTKVENLKTEEEIKYLMKNGFKIKGLELKSTIVEDALTI